MRTGVTKDNTNALYLLLLILAVFVNCFTINTAFFTDDPGLYASISKQLIFHHSFFELYSYGRDWLDKPHFPFWVVMLSFKIFGIHTWSYKLPGLICFLLSLLYTWLFTQKYYGRETGMMAVLILSTALHLIMSNTDVRAEPYLMAFIIGAIYHISNLEKRFAFGDFILAALLTAFAVMTKGVFVFVAIYGALGGQLILQKRFKEVFKLQWILLLLLTLIFITPELYGLYIQFDLHPEKTVFGHQHVSGIKWFLWDSQFGRFTNAGPINRKQGDVFFFLHTLLWAFAPWCLVFYFSIYKIVQKIIKGIHQPEYYAISGGLLLLALFSLSGFQLPFYTNILFPLFAICTARLCYDDGLNPVEKTIRSVAMWLYIVALPLTVVLLQYFLRPGNNAPIISAVFIFGIVIVVIYTSGANKHHKLFFTNCAAMLFACFYVNSALYPEIISNKGELKAAEYVNQQVAATDEVYSLRDQNNIFQFYCNRPVRLITPDNFTATPTAPNAVFYASQETLDELNRRQIRFVTLIRFEDYPQENILPAFINKATRTSTLSKVYLIKKP